MSQMRPPCCLPWDCYRDVPDMLVEWRNAGIKSYIYSSGSREAQRLFFEHSQAGDLRPFLCGFFDTTSGPKTEAASYTNIQHTLGVDDADQVGSLRVRKASPAFIIAACIIFA